MLNSQHILLKPPPDTSFEAVLNRMMLGAGVHTQTELAQVLEIGKAAISDAKRRRIIPAEWYLKLCRPPRRINPIWLECGQEPRYIPDSAPVSAKPMHEDNTSSTPPSPREAHTPKDLPSAPGEYPEAPCPNSKFEPSEERSCEYHTPLLARPGLSSPNHLEDLGPGPFSYSSSWLHLKAAPEKLHLLRITGRAMDPVLCEGDLVLLDASQRDIMEGGIYLLRMDAEFAVKRVAKKPGCLVLLNDNDNFSEPLEVPYPTEQVRVIGRIVWLSREL